MPNERDAHPEPETGRYRLLERITPTGEAWRAEDLEEPDRYVVVKVLPANTDVIAARHIVESLRAIEAPAVNIPIDDGELPDGRPFLVFRYVDGSTLRDLLNQTGPLPLPVTGNLLREIGAALNMLHERQVIYGVLAPEHVIVQQIHGRHKAILLNSGIYRVTGQTSASPGYLAPELLAGQPSFSSDVFSLGVLAAEMLTGRRAFRYGSLNELQRLQRIGIARGSLRTLRAKIPVRVEDDIRRATAWDAAQRPSGTDVFAERVAESLGGVSGFPKRRAFLAGVFALALGAAGMRRCSRR